MEFFSQFNRNRNRYFGNLWNRFENEVFLKRLDPAENIIIKEVPRINSENILYYQDELDLHYHRNAPKLQFECNRCPKQFANKNNLTRQARIHSRENPYKCVICDKAFTRSSHLKCHIRIHTGEKPYKCVTCEKAFSQSSILERHIRIHTGEKPFKCGTCEKAFTRNDQLNKHMRDHIGWKPYE